MPLNSKTRISLKYLLYFFFFNIPLVGYLSVTSNGLFAYLLIIEAFVIIPIIELFLKPDQTNLSTQEEEILKKDKFFDWVLYLCVPALYLVLYFFLIGLKNDALNAADYFGRILSMGTVIGIVGINVAHELGHRKTWYEQLMAKILLLPALYMHFFIEHNRGHHIRVSTKEDPSSSRLNEWLYTFWFRSIISGYFSAWNLEKSRLQKSKKFWLNPSNQMLQLNLIQLSFLGIIFYFFGLPILIYFIIASLIGVLLLETVNYIEHYGLSRQKTVNGKYERTAPEHSWNSSYPLGRIFLFELSRHSDHHFNSVRPYQILKHYDQAGQMPTGYPGMMILATIPPLWFWVMNKRVLAK